MVPAAVVDETIADLLPSRAGRHPHRRRQFLLHRRHPPRQGTRAQGIHYVDVGTSGGVWGLERGYCMMIGGEKDVVSISIRSSNAGAGHRATSRARRGAKSSAAPPSRATCTAARTAPATSSRWCTTASSTASWPPTPRGWRLRDANVGKHKRAFDAETTPLRDPEHYQYDSICATSPRCGGAAA
jgi:6-phosphogluconate dehydrogenase